MMEVIEEQIKHAIKDLSPGESIRTLGILISEVMGVAEETSKEIRKPFNIPIDEIDPFPNHPFRVETDDEMFDLVRSIKKYGMITPGIVRTKNNGRYEMLSGHRRLWACKLAGIDMFRCEVLTMSDEEAALFMIEANRQRMKLYPGEKSQLYKLKTKHSDYRNIRELRIEASDAPWKIRSYMRLDSLIPEIMELVENGSMSLRPASEISMLPRKYQRIVFEEMEYNQSLPTHSQTIRMRNLNDQGVLTPETIAEIMAEEKANQKWRLVVKDERVLSAIPSEIPVSEQEEYIANALENYRKRRRT